MVPIKELTPETIMSQEIFSEILNEEDLIKREELINQLMGRAKELHCKTDFERTLKVFQKVDRETQKKEEKPQKVKAFVDGVTDFEDSPYDNMRCGSWIASDNGVYKLNMFGQEMTACYHPILPVKRLKNMETGEEQIEIAYRRGHDWSTITVPKTVVASSQKIVSLSAFGIAVTSETARNLVKYLADVENFNDEYIKVEYSSGKLGWKEDGFLPYNSKIKFDSESRFKQLFGSIGEHGDKDTWYRLVHELRATGRIEIKMMLAASFSSVLIDPLGALPYFVDLWGETEGGKTVTLMLAASVWANPDENQYIGDFKTTDVALETKADMLNHLPMILDDTSKTSKRIYDNFEGVIYDLCSGKGKSRSNRELGVNRENHWKNCFLTNGERPLSSYADQGGAINRIIEVECREKVYRDPQGTVELLKSNYGYAGRDFIDIVRSLDGNEIRQMQQDFQRELEADDKMQKQAVSMSVILTADRITADYLFKDHQYISISDARELLVDRDEVSDGERTYQYICDKVAMNPYRFNNDAYSEQWGVIENEWVILYPAAFHELCNAGRFSENAFLSWADRNFLLKTSYDGSTKRMTRMKKIGDKAVRCYWIRMELADDDDD